MPLTLSVGVSKKVGLPDYGSVGATCNVTVELDASLLQSDLETFHRHVRSAYVACAQAVNEELARHQPATAPTPNTPPPATNGNVGGNGSGNGNGNGNSNGHADGNGRPAARLATASQVRAICGIAKRQKIDLAAALRERFGVARPDDLSIAQASEFIDAIKPQPSNVGGRP